MCGIAGSIALYGGLPQPEHGLRAMVDTLYHRGPDSEGLDIQYGVAMGMRRLSIIDVEGGRQPIFNEDRSVRAVFNGEIYNFPELREELAKMGHRFHSGSDGEVIVHLWEEHGPDFATFLNGMFAIALHDMRSGRFVLVRDRLGIKPLFYTHGTEYFVFASEIKAIIASGLVEMQLDLDGLGQFLAWEYVPAPGTLFRNVRKLEPGSQIELDLTEGQVRQRCYWEVASIGPRYEEDADSSNDQFWEEAVDQQLRRSVRRQLISDVPLGAFLSGGVDSSLVVAAMGTAKTFSIGFNDPTYNELPWSNRVAEHLHVDHEMETIQPEVVDLFEHLMHFMEDPIGDFSIFPTFLVSRLARQHVTVVLTGDGGDELFGGYDTYLAQQNARLWMKIPNFMRSTIVKQGLDRLRPRPAKKGLINKSKRFIEGLRYDEAEGHARWRQFVGDELLHELLTPEARTSIRTPLASHITSLLSLVQHRSELDRSLYVDLRSYLVDNCLVKTDRMSMACSLEARVPFLDHELVELAFQVPERLKICRNRTKLILKRIAARKLPRDCVYRRKEGFSIPMKHWLGSEFRPILEESLSPSRIAAEGVFEPATVQRLKNEHLRGDANHSHLLWALVVFQDWRRRWGV